MKEADGTDGRRMDGSNERKRNESKWIETKQEE